MFTFILIVHILNTGSKLLNTIDLECLGSWKQILHRYNKRLRVLLIFLQVSMFSELSFSWVFAPEDIYKHCSQNEADWKRFKFFMHVECLISIGNLFGAIVFMLFRSMLHNQIQWDVEEDEKWEETDAIIENLDQINLL